VPLSFLPGAKQGSDWKEQGEVGRLSDPWAWCSVSQLRLDVTLGFKLGLSSLAPAM
jgi:hypothetical protein